ncbi:MAG: hypothetical protein K2N48_12100 [Muribaculaceae bacterium]|nr:hypothetical protein [Muribaculaceae bacterium]
MAKEYSGKNTLQRLINLVKGDLWKKQDKITGAPGEVLMIGENGQVTTSSMLQELLDSISEI